VTFARRKPPHTRRSMKQAERLGSAIVSRSVGRSAGDWNRSTRPVAEIAVTI
jgi:hypothetical protein